MQRLTLNELTAITDIGIEQLKSQRRRGQCALAFGRAEATARLRYVPADCVAVLLTKDLAEVYGAKLAARLMIMFGDVVLRAIAEAEADTSIDVMISVADVETNDHHGHVAYLGRDGSDAAGYIIERVVTVNVSRAISRIRVSASAEHIDLSDRFMPVPGSTEFDTIMAAYAELPGGIVEVGAYRKREVAARRAGERARMIAMGGAYVRSSARVTGVTETAAAI